MKEFVLCKQMHNITNTTEHGHSVFHGNSLIF